MQRLPLVSVVMPCYNAGPYVGQAIASILGQTYQNLELIVVDDKSTDDSVSIINKYLGKKVILIKHDKNFGICKTLNDGIKNSRGEFIARMDADDISDPYRLERQIEVMLDDIDISVVGTGINFIDQEGNYIYYQSKPEEDWEIREAFLYTFPLGSSCQMWRRDKLFKAGLFDEKLPTCEDIELALRLIRIGKAKNIDLPLYISRRNFSQNSNISILRHLERVMLARKAFFLKQLYKDDELTHLYKQFWRHYNLTKTNFLKTQVPEINKAYYYRNIALVHLIMGNRKQYIHNLIKAKQLQPGSLSNIIIKFLGIMPQPIINIMYKVNQMAKRNLYKYYCGDLKK
jgi:glycosyltransferase involved in cell wall biosynthesis